MRWTDLALLAALAALPSDARQAAVELLIAEHMGGPRR